MNSVLRQAVRLEVRQAERTDVHRTPEESRQAEAIAREGRSLLLRDADNNLVEHWFVALDRERGRK